MRAAIVGPLACVALAATLLAPALLAPAAARADPVLDISPTSVDFGAVELAAVAESVLVFRNPGDADLVLGDVTLEHSDFAVGGPSGGVPPGTVIAAGESLLVDIAFRPAVLGPVSATLRVSSTDPVSPEQTVPLSGSGASGAAIQLSPASFAETLDLGQTVTRDLVIRNNGDLALTWNLSVRPVLAGRAPLASRRSSLLGVRVLWDRSKGQISTLPWSVLVSELESRGAVVEELFPGGGDEITTALLASYRVFLSADVQSAWSAAEATALEAWVQAGGGILLIGDNLQSRNHYNTLLTALEVGMAVNGVWTGDTVLSGAAIRSHESTAGVTKIRTRTSPREIIPVDAPAETVLESVGGHVLAAVATLGVGRVALVTDELFDDVTIAEAEGTYDADNRLFGNQLVDWLAGGVWLRPDVASGTVAAADSAVAQLLFDASDLSGGTFHLNVRVESNDAQSPSIDVPASLTVIGVPEIEADPDSIGFADTPEGTLTKRSLWLRNTGTELLNLSGLTSSAAQFSAPFTPLSVAPGDSTEVEVSFLPDSSRAFFGTLTITSDAGTDPSLDVPVTGTGIVNCEAPCAAPSLRPADITGSDGFQFWLDVILSGNPAPIGSFGFDLHFDPGHLTFLDSWRADSLVTLAQAQEVEPGVVRVGGFASPSVPVAFEGSLMQLLFTVDCSTCPAGEQSDLFVSRLIDDLAGVDPCCGRLTLADCPTGHGDINDDAILTATDALCALKIFVSGGTVPADTSCQANGDCEVEAADVNCDGPVTPADALAIYERALCVADPVPLPCFALTEPDPCGPPVPGRGAGALAWGAVETTDDGWLVELNAAAAPGAFGLELELPPGVELVRLDPVPGPGQAFAAWAALAAATARDGRVRVGGVAGPARGRDGAVARLVLRGAVGGSLRVVEPIDAAFAGPRERDLPSVRPPEAGLLSVHPNPSAGEVTIAFAADRPGGRRELTVHDVRGRVARRLHPGSVGGDGAGTGRFQARWDGRDESGRPVAGGIYFVVLRLDDRVWTRKALVVR